MSKFVETERDMLIRIDENIKLFCGKLSKMEKKLDKHIDHETDYLTTNTWRWATKIICAICFSLICGAYAYTYNVDVAQNAHAKDWNIHVTDKEIK